MERRRANPKLQSRRAHLRQLAGLGVGLCLCQPSVQAAVPEVPDARLAAAGLRRLQGRHFQLITDVAASEEVESLPAVFDQAMPLWGQYFGIPETQYAGLKFSGFLAADKARFESLGLWPADLPPFLHGYSRDETAWWYDQPGDYYRRHLMLHEGTHLFMQSLLGGMGPPWYMEGMAEFLATHAWENGTLRLGIMPKSREAAPYWGRIAIVARDIKAGRAQTLPQVVSVPLSSFLETRPYGWSWAAVTFLSCHPTFGGVFNQVSNHLRLTDFEQDIVQTFGALWPQVCLEWNQFIQELDYGYDCQRNAWSMLAQDQPVDEIGQTAKKLTLAVDRAWQAMPCRLRKGTLYTLEATGRFEVANTGQVWTCEPNGVSIRYVQGHPLGMLLAAVLPDDAAQTLPALPLNVLPVGSGTQFSAEATGQLFLKINESPAEWADNKGQVQVTIRAYD